MTTEDIVRQRASNQCETCSSANGLGLYVVGPSAEESAETSAYLCETCRLQLSGEEDADPDHWRCLNDAIWSEVDVVKVIAWRMLWRLKDEGWPLDLLDMMYMEEELLAWAREGVSSQETSGPVHKDSNGSVLHAGDQVTLIKDLPVKGAGFTAKRGTAVRNISLVEGNPEHIEGKVNGQQIVILTKFVKRNN